MNLLIEGPPLPGLLTLLATLEVDAVALSWHLADIEACPWPPEAKAGWFDGGQLISYMTVNETQFIWGVFDAFPAQTRFAVDGLPCADGNGDLWNGNEAKPQVPDALFEIVYWDGTHVLLLGLSPEQVTLVQTIFPEARPPS